MKFAFVVCETNDGTNSLFGYLVPQEKFAEYDNHDGRVVTSVAKVPKELEAFLTFLHHIEGMEKEDCVCFHAFCFVFLLPWKKSYSKECTSVKFLQETKEILEGSKRAIANARLCVAMTPTLPHERNPILQSLIECPQTRKAFVRLLRLFYAQGHAVATEHGRLRRNAPTINN